MKTFLALTLSLLGLVLSQAGDDERIFLDAKINGKPVRFIVDTGTSVPFVLFSKTAEKLKLKVTPDTNVTIGTNPGWTEPQTIDFGTTNFAYPLSVIEVPSRIFPSVDGILGWPAFRAGVFYLNCTTRSIIPYTNAPANSNGWSGYWIQTNVDFLALQMFDKSQSNGIVILDTGSPYGVMLNSVKWNSWKMQHTYLPFTMEAYYTPNIGVVVSEEGWAESVSLGNLALTDVPVMRADSGDLNINHSSKSNFMASLGFAALKRLDILIDVSGGAIWLRPKETPPEPYQHNRLGASFVPESMRSKDLIAHVINDSPAYEAGIRNGDVLLRIDGQDVTNWPKTSVGVNFPFHDKPAGAKIHLTLKRGAKIFKATATLRNIIPPDSFAVPN